MNSRRDHQGSRLALATLVALVVHLGAVPALQWVVMRPIDPQPQAARPMEPVPLLTEADVAKMLGRSRLSPSPKVTTPKPRPKPPKPPEKPRGQVVEIPPPDREEIPEHAKLRSEYNSKVEREQQHRNREAPQSRVRKSDRRLVSMGDDIDGISSAARAKARSKARARADARDGREDARPGEREKPERSRTAARGREADQNAPMKATVIPEGEGRFRPRTEVGAREALVQPSGGASGGARAEEWRALLPSLGPEDLARKDGSIDHLDDLDQGDATFLNTREYRHAWFFNRVKRSVQRRWRAVEVHRRHDPRGRVYGVRDRLTVVEVVLTPEGVLDDISVNKDSGIAFLDEVALQAFRDAQPFPNPPAALRDGDGRIRFKFGFHLEIDGRGFRTYRYR